MPRSIGTAGPIAATRQAGFSLAELLVATTILMTISGITMAALLQMTTSQQTIWNRTQMHASVRSVTELLQQEVGQAGRVALPGPVTLTSDVAAGGQTVTVSATNGMFVGELLVVGAGSTSETVVVSGIDAGASTITANSQTGSTGVFFGHASGAPVAVYGGFASGIVPPAPAIANGSTDKVLKLYGDINSDGNMLYIEYTCDAGKVSRNSMAWDAASKAARTGSQTLLSNLQPNPGGVPCFTYQQETVGANTYVINVAMTLTVRTQVRDPITGQDQTETNALLNVSPRNVFEAWELASQGSLNRIQPMPPSIANLLP